VYTANEPSLNGTGSKVSLGLQKPDGRQIEVQLSRADINNKKCGMANV
jgi:hypothetical protein